MIAVGFIVWQARNDSSTKTPGTSASEVKTIWCVPEAVAACNATNVQSVVEMTPAAIEDAIVAARTRDALDTNAIVAPDYWLRRWNKVIAFNGTTNLAASAVVAVQKAGTDKNCEGKLNCLLALERRLSLPSLSSSSSGLLASALALKAASVQEPIDDTETKTADAIAAIKAALQEQDSNAMFRNLLSASILDAAVMTKAEFVNADPAQALQTPVIPAGTVTMGVGTFTDSGLSALKESLSGGFTTNGWDPLGTPANAPADTYLNDTYEALR